MRGREGGRNERRGRRSVKGGRREDAAGDVEKRRSPVPSVPIALCLWWVFHRALIGLLRTGPLIFFRGVTGRYGLEISPLGSLRADRMARIQRRVENGACRDTDSHADCSPGGQAWFPYQRDIPYRVVPYHTSIRTTEAREWATMRSMTMLGFLICIVASR